MFSHVFSLSLSVFFFHIVLTLLLSPLSAAAPLSTALLTSYLLHPHGLLPHTSPYLPYFILYFKTTPESMCLIRSHPAQQTPWLPGPQDLEI